MDKSDLKEIKTILDDALEAQLVKFDEKIDGTMERHLGKAAFTGGRTCQAKNRFYESTQYLIQPRRVRWIISSVMVPVVTTPACET